MNLIFGPKNGVSTIRMMLRPSKNSGQRLKGDLPTAHFHLRFTFSHGCSPSDMDVNHMESTGLTFVIVNYLNHIWCNSNNVVDQALCVRQLGGVCR